MAFHLVQQGKVVEAITPQAGAAITGDVVSMKNYDKCFVVVHVNQANAAQVAITVQQAAEVGGVAKALTNNVRIWANEDCAASDALVAQTAAKAFTTSVAVKHKVVVFEVERGALDLANNYDCVVVSTAASDATNITSGVYVLTGARYAQCTPPSAIVD